MALLAASWKGRHGKSVTASVHTHSLGGRKTAAEFATDRSVECATPVPRWGATVAAGMVTRLLTGRPRNPGSIATEGNIFVSSPKRQDRLWCPPAFCSVGTTDSFPRVNVAGTWSWPLTASVVDVRVEWSCISISSYAFMAYTGTNFCTLTVTVSCCNAFPYVTLQHVMQCCYPVAASTT